MRIADSDAMLVLTRVAMLLCTLLTGVLVWEAQSIVQHMQEQDVKIEQEALHQATADGSILMLQNMETENARRIGKLEDMVIAQGILNGSHRQ